jgi:hypothetical protein
MQGVVFLLRLIKTKYKQFKQLKIMAVDFTDPFMQFLWMCLGSLFITLVFAFLFDPDGEKVNPVYITIIAFIVLCWIVKPVWYYTILKPWFMLF